MMETVCGINDCVPLSPCVQMALFDDIILLLQFRIFNRTKEKFMETLQISSLTC